MLVSNITPSHWIWTKWNDPLFLSLVVSCKSWHVCKGSMNLLCKQLRAKTIFLCEHSEISPGASHRCLSWDSLPFVSGNSLKLLKFTSCRSSCLSALCMVWWARQVCVHPCHPLHTLISLTSIYLPMPSLDRGEAEQWLFPAQLCLGIHLPLSFRAVSPPSNHKSELSVKQGSSMPIHWNLAKSNTWKGEMTLWNEILPGKYFSVEFGWMFCCFCLVWLRLAYKVWT